MARKMQTARKPKTKKQKKEVASDAEENTTEEQENEVKEEIKEVESIEEDNNEEDNNEESEETTETVQTKEENKETTEETTEENKGKSDNTDFHKARRTLYIHFPPGPIGESGMEMLDNVYKNNGKLVLPQLVCFAAFPSEEIVESIKPKLEDMEVNGKPLAVKFMGAKGTDMDDPCINPYRIKVQGLLVYPEEKQVAKKFPAGKITQTIKKLKCVILDFNTKEEAAEALKSAKGLKFGDKPVRVSYVREASEDWMEEFQKRKAEREAANKPSKKQKLDDEGKKEGKGAGKDEDVEMADDDEDDDNDDDDDDDNDDDDDDVDGDDNDEDDEGEQGEGEDGEDEAEAEEEDDDDGDDDDDDEDDE